VERDFWSSAGGWGHKVGRGWEEGLGKAEIVETPVVVSLWVRKTTSKLKQWQPTQERCETRWYLDPRGSQKKAWGGQVRSRKIDEGKRERSEGVGCSLQNAKNQKKIGPVDRALREKHGRGRGPRPRLPREGPPGCPVRRIKPLSSEIST